MTVASFASLRVGQCASFSKTISESDVYLFAGITGDFNAVHINQVAAEQSVFKTRVAHGMLSASLLSTVGGMMLGTPGGLYVEQTLRFRRPVFIGDTLTARAELTSIDAAKRCLHCATTIVNQHGKVVIDGASVLQKD